MQIFCLWRRGVAGGAILAAVAAIVGAMFISLKMTGGSLLIKIGFIM